LAETDRPAREELVASDDLDLCAVLASRICHDLVGPVGAIGNGLELLAEEDDPQMRAQALDLLSHSADQAARRLTFYRLAFGASGGADMAVSLTEARGAAERWLQGGRTTLAWADADTAAELSKPRLRLLLNLLLVAVEALPRGGTVTVAIAAGGRQALVRAAGPGAAVEPAIDGALDGRAAAATLTPKQLPAYLAARLAAEQGATLNHGAAPGEVRLEAAFRGA
jgi:histidine phosphotransferase ChpT